MFIGKGILEPLAVAPEIPLAVLAATIVPALATSCCAF